MDFEWDPEKAESNFRKHTVTFDEAKTIFSDRISLTFPDPDHSEQEFREITIGTSAANRVLIVAHTNRLDRIRIISARKATPRERKVYEEEFRRQR